MRVRYTFLLLRLAACASLLLTAAPLRGQERPLLSQPLGVVWKYETGGTVNFTPAQGGGSVYLPLQNGEVVSLRASGGELNWRAEVGGSFSAAPAADEAALYVASESVGAAEKKVAKSQGAVRALSHQSGVTLWLRTLPAPIRGRLVAWGDAVYGGAEDGRLYALKKATGEVLWIRQHSSPFLSQPVLAGSRLYIGDEAGNLIAVEPVTGRTLWRYQTPKSLRAPVGMGEGLIFAGSQDGYVYALEVGSGVLRWRARTGGAVQSVVPAGKCLLVTSLDNFAYCLSPRKGYRMWKRQLPGRVAAQPLVTEDGILLAPLSGEECVVLAPRDGRKLNSINVGEDNNTGASPVLVGRLVLLTTRKGLFAYSDAESRADGASYVRGYVRGGD
jgi:outer membrane protein assembly factor BamB